MKRITLFVAFVIIIAVNGFAQTINDPFFEKVTYRGAFGAEDWTKGWSNFDPQNTNYGTNYKTVEAGDITGDVLWQVSPLLGAASFSDPALNNSFFDKVDFIGAIGNDDWTKMWANFDPQNTNYPATTVTISGGDITTDTKWTANNVYLLNGWVYVTAGATLTIEAGTIIRGDKTSMAALIIERGGKLIAEGTADKPIVFTSNQPAGSRAWSDWGGLVICGKAKINNAAGEAQIEGGPRSIYGGTDDADNSGILKYVRLEYSGYPFQKDKEINGLTLGAVGSGTTINYVQVSYCGDDSYEWFGGTVNAKHLISLAAIDDDFDSDFGFSGKVQFAISLRDPNKADVSGSNGFESDNDGTGTNNTPYTSPVFCNVSMFGPLATAGATVDANHKRAAHIRRNSRLSIFNSVFAGYKTGLFIDGSASQTAAVNGDLKIRNTIIAGTTPTFAVTSPKEVWEVADEEAWFKTVAFNNSVLGANSDLMIVDPFKLDAPNFNPVNAIYLNGWVYVTNNATLTIKPGTVIRGDKTSMAAIIVERGGKIIAEGTKEKPIVMTSAQPAGSRSWSDWGGLVICGKAKINNAAGEAQIEGGPRSIYGGTDDADNSGVLKYVRLEYSGYPFQKDKEINGLTLGAVGSGTTIDYVQVSYCGDDSYEWFGGTVNAKHLISLAAIDDDFDSDFGFHGMIQFAVSLRDPNKADVSGSNGFESDNDGTGTNNTPYTSPIFANVSMFGPLAVTGATVDANHKRAAHIRRNSRLSLYNTVFAGYKTGLFIDGSASQTAAVNGDLKIFNTIIAGTTPTFAVTSPKEVWEVADEEAWYKEISRKNQVFASNDEIKVTDPFNLTNPNFLPNAGSPLLTNSFWFPTAINSLAATDHAINIYPNPIQSTLYVKSEVAFDKLIITNSIGKQIRIVSVNKTQNLDVITADLPNGLYVVSIYSNGALLKNAKLVK